jgi:Sulfotransferase family
MRAEVRGQGSAPPDPSTPTESNPGPRRPPGEPREDHLATVNVRVCPNPVFVIGSPRSGTSIVPWSLAHTWDFWTSDETEFVHGLFDRAQAVYEELSKKPRTFITENDVERKEFLGALGLGVNALISSRCGRKRWIDQSPGYTTMAWALADMFPGAYFLHVLRDGRAVVNSMIHFRGGQTDQASGREPRGWSTDFRAAVETWTHYVEFALRFCAQHPDRALTVRNEDLVANPEEEFAKMLTFLGAKQNVTPANFFRSSRINSSFEPLVWGTATATEKVDHLARRRAADAWQEWSDEQRATFTEIAGDLMRRLGYWELG